MCIHRSPTLLSLYSLYLIFIYSNIRRGGPFPRVCNVDVDGGTLRRDIRRIDGILHFFSMDLGLWSRRRFPPVSFRD